MTGGGASCGVYRSSDAFHWNSPLFSQVLSQVLPILLIQMLMVVMVIGEDEENDKDTMLMKMAMKMKRKVIIIIYDTKNHRCYPA